MNILNINSYYYSSTVHKQLVTHLQSQGVSSLTYVPLVKGYSPREECKYGSENHVVTSECFNKPDRYIFHVKHRKILKDITNRICFTDFNYSHAHSLFSNGYIALQIKRRYGLPYVVTVRDTDMNTFFKYMLHLRGLGIEILQEADKIIFLSATYRDYLFEKYFKKPYAEEVLNKTVVIPNGIDSYWLRNINTPRKVLENQTLNLIYVGAVSKRKNITTTIKAIEILRERGYNVKFTVVGKLVDKSVIENIKRLRYVNYLGQKNREDLLEIYRNNDIFVMPSITETFGLVYAEAMSQGLPIIYTKGQGFDGQFQEGLVGYSVGCYNSDQIADRIIKLVNSYENTSKNCINLCGKFDWNTIAAEYKNTYNLNK